MAEAPWRVGAGSRVGQVKDRLMPPSVIVASGAVPPAENDRPVVVAFGTTLPPAPRRKRASRLTHDCPCLTRVGCSVWVSMKVPRGVAAVVEVAVVKAATGTGLPVFRACAD